MQTLKVAEKSEIKPLSERFMEITGSDGFIFIAVDVERRQMGIYMARSMDDEIYRDILASAIVSDMSFTGY